MRQSQRQRDRRKRSTTVPLQTKRVKLDSEPPFEKHNSTSSFDEELEDVLRQWFYGMIPHVWFKIIPSSADDVNSISFAMGQPWDLVSAVLIRLKFIVKYRDDYRISHDKFKEFQNKTMYHLGSSHRKGYKKVHYICNSLPLHKNPSKEENAGHSYTKLRYAVLDMIVY